MCKDVATYYLVLQLSRHVIYFYFKNFSHVNGKTLTNGVNQWENVYRLHGI